MLASAHALVKKVNKSSKATERLVYLCRKKLISDCPTQWSSTFLMIERLLDVKDALSTVLEELCWDNLHTSEWKLLASIHDLHVEAFHPIYIPCWRGRLHHSIISYSHCNGD